jgi:hypothetical protein
MIAEELFPRYSKQLPRTPSSAEDPSHDPPGGAEGALTKIRYLLGSEVDGLGLAGPRHGPHRSRREETGRNLRVGIAGMP